MAKRCGVNKPCHRGIKGGLFSPFFNNGVDLSGYGLGPGPGSSSGGGTPANGLTTDSPELQPLQTDDGQQLTMDP